MGRKTPEGTYTKEETQRRVEATLRAAFNTPRKPKAKNAGASKKNRARKTGEKN
jgi:hypothetical protein